MPTRHYMTTNGLPPNGGAPPQATHSMQAMQYSTLHYSAPPPYSAMPAFTTFHPPDPTFQTNHWRPWSVPQPVPLPPPPQSLPVPAPAPPPPKTPPGATLNGLTPRFPNGPGYIFPPVHTLLHIIQPNYAPWDNPGGTFQWRAFVAPSCITVRDLIKQLGGGSRQTDGIAECLDIGDGIWLKGSVFMIGEEKSKETLGKLGWDETRGLGGGGKPAWIAVWKG